MALYSVLFNGKLYLDIYDMIYIYMHDIYSVIDMCYYCAETQMMINQLHGIYACLSCIKHNLRTIR